MVIKPFKDTIRFETEGNTEFFFLGTGSAFSKKYFQTNILIIKGREHLLIDCGTMCSYVFYTYNSSLAKVKNFLVTHSHADHIGGLEEAALISRYTTKQRPSMVITDAYKKTLWEQSLRGGISYGEALDKRFLSFDDYFNQIRPKLIFSQPRPIFQTNIGDIDIKIFQTNHLYDNTSDWEHTFFSCGILIDERVFFTGDTRFDPALLDLLFEHYPSIEWIFHDCQFFSGGVHSFYGDLKTLPDKVKAKIYLCHYGDTAEKYTPKKDGFAGLAQTAFYYSLD